MIEILHYVKDPKLSELWYVPYCNKEYTIIMSYAGFL